MDTSGIELTTADPAPDDVQYLEERIYEFNTGATGLDDGAWLAFFVREGDRIVAGICGNTWGGTCELRQFWVETSRRSRGAPGAFSTTTTSPTRCSCRSPAPR